MTHPNLVVQRALATVDVVNNTIAQMQASGEVKEINAAFKAARIEAPSLRYRDYLQGRKVIMIEAMAMQMR